MCYLVQRLIFNNNKKKLQRAPKIKSCVRLSRVVCARVKIQVCRPQSTLCWSSSTVRRPHSAIVRVPSLAFPSPEMTEATEAPYCSVN